MRRAASAAWKKQSLRRQLPTLFVVLSLGPMFLMNLLGYLSSRRYLTDAAFRNLSNVAALEATTTARFVKEKRDVLPTLIAGNEYLFVLLRALESDDEAVHARVERELQAQLAAKAGGSDAVDDFFVFSPAGVLLASSRPDRTSGSDGLQRCYAAGRKAVQVAGFADGPAGEPMLLVAAPVRDSAGVFRGVLCGRFRFDVHDELILAHHQRTTHADLYLIDVEGGVVCGSSAVSHHGPLGRRGDHDARGPDAWEARYDIAPAGDTLGAYTPVPEIGGGVLVEMPVAEAMSSLNRLKWEAFGIGTLLAASLLAVLFVTVRAVTRPLESLARAAKRTAEGARGESVPQDGPTEIVELATAFNRMSFALKDSHELLEHRIAERTAQLQQSREFAELLLDSIDEPVLVIDRDLRIFQANRTAVRLFGSDLVGRRYHEAMTGHEEPSTTSPFTEAFETGRVQTAEARQQMEGHEEIVSLQFFPVLRSDGGVEAVIQIGRVITAEKRLQARMMHQEKMAAFGLLAASVAHEIGNPLAAMLSQLHVTRESRDPSRLHQTLDIMETELQRMSRLLRDLVDVSRRRRDEVALVSVNQAAEDVARLLAHDPRARNVRIERELAATIPGVRAKEDLLVQVLLNLGINALDAMPEGGTLRFDTAAEDGYVLARVRDTGSGISDAARRRLFEPFFTTKESRTGTGLGLFVSKGIVESLGGKLSLESTGAEGTTFALRIPIDRPKQEVTA